jgi:hypothetical protein
MNNRTKKKLQKIEQDYQKLMEEIKPIIKEMHQKRKMTSDKWKSAKQTTLIKIM